ncbi:hypothetical protein PINS_up018349 [Pythium insidiosum]|nr:hypothetical protein PINS_up018349 [Pythium insidiosum]
MKFPSIPLAVTTLLLATAALPPLSSVAVAAADDAPPLDFGDLGDLPPLQPNGTGEGPHDHHFKPGPPPPGKRGPPGEFSVRGPGGRLQLCPSADCNGTAIDLVAHHLVEMTADRKPTKHVVKGFGVANWTWSTPSTKLNADGVNVTSSVAVANLTVAGVQTPVRYKAEVSFFHGNATAKNGEQIIDVPGGALKFAVWIDDWPFLNASNVLHLGYRVVARKAAAGASGSRGNGNGNGAGAGGAGGHPDGAGDRMDKAEVKRGQGRDKKVDRVQLLTGLFLDSPALAQVDGAMVSINSTLLVSPDSVVVDYAFPKFTSLFYDPVMAADDATAGGTTPTPTPTPAPTPTLRSAAWSLSRAVGSTWVLVVVLAGAMAL